MVYLIYFTEKLHYAQHYIGFVEDDLLKRIAEHKANKGAKLLAAVNDKGIDWKVVRVWRGEDRNFERKLKNNKNAKRFCPVCGCKY